MGLAVFEVLALGAVSCEVSPVRGGELWVGLGFWLVAACYCSEEAVGQGSAAIAAMRLLASITATAMIGAVVRFVPCVGAGSFREPWAAGEPPPRAVRWCGRSGWWHDLAAFEAVAPKRLPVRSPSPSTCLSVRLCTPDLPPAAKTPCPPTTHHGYDPLDDYLFSHEIGGPVRSR
ncbi:hypothetical protein F3K43_17165 [Streptomyces sp. LBUM 1476]|nr:hypothetical protein [Streptomyces sp. LBUM 1476]GAQ55093.1 hypothetical protein a10_04913 [Streptomyces acidiscabies]GAV38693.1 hypothetical protein Saa2_01575 [Streptomyces acidiscabies]